MSGLVTGVTGGLEKLTPAYCKKVCQKVKTWERKFFLADYEDFGPEGKWEARLCGDPHCSQQAVAGAELRLCSKCGYHFHKVCAMRGDRRPRWDPEEDECFCGCAGKPPKQRKQAQGGESTDDDEEEEEVEEGEEEEDVADLVTANRCQELAFNRTFKAQDAKAIMDKLLSAAEDLDDYTAEEARASQLMRRAPAGKVK